MDYYIIDGELVHAKKTKEWKNHKYVAKVQLKNSGGSKKRKFRYFYTLADWKAYLKEKNTPKKESVKTKIKTEYKVDEVLIKNEKKVLTDKKKIR